MHRTVSLTLLLAASLACTSGGRGGKPADPAPGATAAAPQPADPPPCDWKIKAMSDPGQKLIQCPNGESFVVRRGDDNQWYEEMKVRAGTRPGYATPEEAARARCCNAGGSS